MSSHSYAFERNPAKGGLIQVVSHRNPRASRTEGALQASRQGADPTDYFFWAADEGLLYPESIHQEWDIPLSRLLLAKARDAPEVWRLGLEAAQTGLFHSVFLRPSRACPPAALRKLQLVAEKMRCEVFLLTKDPLPHWTLKHTLEVGKNANPVPTKRPAAFPPRGERLHPHAESVPAGPF